MQSLSLIDQSHLRLIWARRMLLAVLVVVSSGFRTEAADKNEMVSIMGVLVDQDDKQPLPGMAIAIRPERGQEDFIKKTVCVTDVNGRFEIDVPAALDPSRTSQRPPGFSALPINGEQWKLTACDPGRKLSMFELVTLAGSSGFAEWRNENGRQTIWARVQAPGELQAIVRDNGGEVLVDTDVLVAWNYGQHGRAGWRGRTDANGRFRLQCRPYNGSLVVISPGQGVVFMSGLTVKAKQVTQAELPPLIPLAQINGIVKADFSPGDEIEIDQFGWDNRHSAIQPDGSFELTEVIPGFSQLRLRHVVGPASQVEHKNLGKVLVSPGQRISDLVFGAGEQLPIPESLPSIEHAAVEPVDKARQLARLNGKETIFATGRVTDTRGQPLRDCRVVVTNQYHGGLRMMEKTVETRTDGNGTWRVENVRTGIGGVMAAVFAPGRPVTYARGSAVGLSGTGRGTVIGIGGIQTIPALSTATTDEATAPHVRADAIVTDHGGSIVVRVLEQQGPATEGFVQLRLNDWYQRAGFGWSRAQTQDERNLRESTWQFTQPINAQGVVSFDNLPAGEYTAYAVDGSKRDVAALANNSLSRSQRLVKGRVHRGLVSVADEERKYLLQLGSSHAAVPLRALGPGGDPIASQNIGLEYQRVSARSGRLTSRKLNADGRVDFYVDTPSLWHIAFKGRDGGIRQFPVRNPDVTGTTVIGASSLLSPQHTREIRLGSNPRAADAVLRVVDRDGGAARAYVRISEIGSLGRPVLVGATDSSGEIRFRGFDATRNHEIVVWFSDSRPFLPFSIKLSDEQLLASRAPQFSNSFFRRGHQVEVKEQSQSYIRGHAVFPPGLEREHYRLDVPIQGVSHAFDPATGEFLVGPLSTRSLRLTWRHRGTPQNVDAADAILFSDVSVEPDSVANVDVSPQAIRRDKLWAARNRNWQPVAGRVWLFDKETPASNARFEVYAANTRQPVSAGWSDPFGHFRTAALHVFSQPDASPIDSKFAGPVLVAWIPGKTDRVVVPLTFSGNNPQKIDVVLPRGHRVEGRVNIAGRSALVVAAPITIAIRHSDDSRLSSLSSQRITANADGTFEFVGLTPGRYECQAALDGMWLSTSLEVNVTGDLRDLVLKIPSPGGTAQLQFNRGDGSPWRHHSVEVDWPEGPLTCQLRPAELTTDYAGNVYVDGAAAGQTRVRLRGERDWHDVRIKSPSRTPPALQIVEASLGL